MTLQDKLAALSPLSSVDSWKEDGIGQLVVYAKDYNALLARNALLCDALETLIFHHDAACSSFTRCEAENDAKDVLAACEVKP